MTQLTNKPDGRTKIENLHHLQLYKLHNTPVGEARQSLDDYVDVADEYFFQIYVNNEPVEDIPAHIPDGGVEHVRR